MSRYRRTARSVELWLPFGRSFRALLAGCFNSSKQGSFLICELFSMAPTGMHSWHPRWPSCERQEGITLRWRSFVHPS